MQIDLAAHLEKLLFLHDTVIIPDFGAFVATRTAAAVDYGGGTVNPPSKTLVFNENIKADDGLLLDDITRNQGIALEDARRLVQEFVEKTQALLNQREIVSLPNIGRLYKNYVQKIQFLPDSANFNSESYGLPPLQFSPIGRSREVTEKPAETASATASPNINSRYASNTVPVVTQPEPSQTGSEIKHKEDTAAEPVPVPAYEPARTSYAGTWITLAVVVIGGLAAATWWWKHRQEAELAGNDPAAIERPAAETGNNPHINTAPTRAEENEAAEKRETARSKAAPGEPAAKKAKPAQEAPQTDAPAGTRQCILVVATLKDQANIDRLKHMLGEAGYQVYSAKKGGEQVGIQFNYRNLNEVQEKIVALQKLTGEQEIWIKKK